MGDRGVDCVLAFDDGDVITIGDGGRSSAEVSSLELLDVLRERELMTWVNASRLFFAHALSRILT